MTTQKQLTQVEAIAWAAGILEGEGCFSICQRKTNTHNHKTVAIHCEMSDEWTVRRLSEVFGIGTVNARLSKNRKDGCNRKDTWIWSVQNHIGVEHVINLIFNYLSPRRADKACELLDYIKSRRSYDAKTNLVNPQGG